MRLRLTVTSEEQFDLGHRARFEFDTRGGTIGRNASCTWVLPDSTHTMSSRHAAISHNGRGFLITDTSTNGVYVNTVEAPIGRGNTSLLAPGDTLYLGNYVVSVEVVEDAAEERQRLGISPHAASVRADAHSGPLPVQAAAARPDPHALLAGLTRPPAAPTVIPTAFGGSPADLPGASLRPGEVPAPKPNSLPPFDTLLGGPPLVSQKASAPPAWPGEPPIAAALPAASVAPPPAVPSQRTGIPDDFFADLMGLPGRAPSVPPAAGGGLGASSTRPSTGNDPLQALGPARPAGLPPAAPTIPASFDLKDAFGNRTPAGPAPLPPLPASGPAEFGSAASWPAPSPAPLPQPPVVPSPLPPPSAAEAPEARLQRRPISEALSADLVALRLPGAEPEATPLPSLDPVAVLRRRGAAVGAAASPASAMPAPTLPPRAMEADRESTPPRLREMPLPQSPIPATPAAAGPAPAVGPGSDEATLAFWRGLGLDPAQISPEARAQLLGEFGKALREALNGLVPILGARRSLKDELRIDQTRLQPRENNPLKFLPSGDAVLQALIAREAAGFLPLSKAVREGFEDVRAHEVAAVVALDAVIGNLLRQFDPAAMEQSGPSGRLFGRGPDKTKLWDRFVSLHASLVGNLEETTRKLVAEEFARAYAQQVENLRRGAS
jgi:predicted component of type VI protein secretion system